MKKTVASFGKIPHRIGPTIVLIISLLGPIILLIIKRCVDNLI